MDPRTGSGQVIPGKIVRFLDEHANVAIAGTRDRDLVPHGHLLSGWRVSGDGRTLTVYVAERFTAHLLESLDDNGMVAATIEEFPSHETYQFKGRYREHRLVNAADLEVVDRVCARFVRGVRPMFSHFPERLLQAFVGRPSLAVEVEVHDIYLQTPGPGAGRRLVPPEAAGGDVPAPETPRVHAAAATPHGGREIASVRLPEAIGPALDGGTPAAMVTCSGDGVPNTTVISQVYPVDPTHVALSFQFFSKTIRNVRENPRALVAVPQIQAGAAWVLQLAFEHSETDGPVFDAMEMQIEAIASATGMSGIFKLRAADIYRVLSVERVPYAP